MKKVTRVVRTKFESSRVIFRKVTRVESFPKKMKVTRVESESLKNATRVESLTRVVPTLPFTGS